MNWKKGFIGFSVLLLLLGSFGIYKLNDMQEIKKENKQISNKLKALDSAHEKSKKELQNKESDIEKINKELEKSKKELAVSQEITVNNDQAEYNHLEQEVNAKYHEGADMGMTHAEAYGIPYVDEQLPGDHIANITDEEANENVRKRDEFAASFEAEHGRQPTSGEIQSQWAKEQGYE
ncbi:hypothetical protein ACWN8P_01090 [Vagococcus salmoninarum]|uniref:Uncharacterized protein n=1 Tax=Vagococcus salmoninarum TaxID=2739 RepID=A0A429ZVX8_9ENTE|nr:hypothetical protein [Vagococcus salmoninarum]RST97796.1 hypothetical protein CBF35_00445 [Vagococcus salmoninarum]